MQIALLNAVTSNPAGAPVRAVAPMVLDFTRARAFWNGASVGLDAVLECTRPTPGAAPGRDGTLHEFAPNRLRCTSRGLLVEESRTNYFPFSTNPAPATINLGVGTHVAWMRGTGSLTLSGSASGIATASAPLSFTMEAAGAVSVALSGEVEFVQVEKGAFATSPIFTAGDSAHRALDAVRFRTASWLDPHACTIFVEWEQVAPGSGVQTLVRWDNVSYSRIRSGNAAIAQVNSEAGVLVFNAAAPVVPPPVGIHRFVAALAPDDMVIGWSASLGGGVAEVGSPGSGTPAAGASVLHLGSSSSNEVLNGYLRKVLCFDRRLPASEILKLL